MKLPEAEIARYHEQGRLVPSSRLPSDVLESMHEAYACLSADNADVVSDIMLCLHLEKPGAQGVEGSRAWFGFVTQPVLLDMATQLVGDNSILWGTTIFGNPTRCDRCQGGSWRDVHRPRVVANRWPLRRPQPDNSSNRGCNYHRRWYCAHAIPRHFNETQRYSHDIKTLGHLSFRHTLSSTSIPSNKQKA